MNTDRQFLSIGLSVNLVFVPFMLDGCTSSGKASGCPQAEPAPQSGEAEQAQPGQQPQHAPATTIAKPTVTYVANSYKYYIAYKLVAEQQEERIKELQQSQSK